MRVFTEALLRDGWGVLDDVEIVDIVPPDLPAAIKEGRIDATTWNIMSVTAEGPDAMAPQLLQVKGAHWIPVETETVNEINKANDFKIENSSISGAGGEQINLLSFRQALAAWESTPDETVNAILACLEAKGAASSVLPAAPREMARWPGLVKEHVHAAALEYYQRRGVAPDQR
ncbi:hypothetical protein [Hyphococcus luteus]|uniref:hypothetical protein n=1 Tax=Hyphococcus luteus TaxID=2058213 RepID=UPI0013FDCD70|nr:hypothetical protein [Marinicaulis flavus]